MKALRIPSILAGLLASFSVHAALWSDATDLGNSWKSLDWFGDFWSDSDEAGWIYHESLGWVYAAGETQAEIALYLSEAGWLTTGDMLYPAVYADSVDKWYIYNEDSLTAFPLQWFDVEAGLFVSQGLIAYEAAVSEPLPSTRTLVKSIAFTRHGERVAQENFSTDPQWPDYMLSRLTTTGGWEHNYLGKLFRQRLVTQTGLLPTTTGSNSLPQIYAVADSATRCEESALSFFYGLMQASDYEIEVVSDSYAPNLFGYFSDSTSHQLNQEVMASEDWAALNRAMTETPADEPYATRWARDSGYSAVALDPSGNNEASPYDIGDFLLFNWIKGIPLPAGFSNDDINQSWSFLNRSQNLLMSVRELAWIESKYQREAFYNALEGKTPTGEETEAVFFLFCGHDGNLWPIMGMLGLALEQNPYFASFLEIAEYEITGEAGLEDGRYIGLTFNGIPLSLDNIGGSGQLMSKAAFMQYLANAF